MKRWQVVGCYILGVIGYLDAIHPLLDQTSSHDIWDTILWASIGTVFLCQGIAGSKSLKKDGNSNSDGE